MISEVHVDRDRDIDRDRDRDRDKDKEHTREADEAHPLPRRISRIIHQTLFDSEVTLCDDDVPVMSLIN